jgi:hypothetical protein
LIQDEFGNVRGHLDGKTFFIFLNNKWKAEVVSKERLSGHYWVQSGQNEEPEVLYYSPSKGWISSVCNYVDSDFFRIWETKLLEPKWK